MKVIRKWLNTRFGLDVDPFTLIIDEPHKLIAKILHDAHKINSNQYELFINTTSAIDWFNYLYFTLAQIGIETKDYSLIKAINGERNAVFKLLYQIYIKLENIDDKSTKHSFHILSLSETDKEHESEIELFEAPKCSPLLEKWDLIHWYRDHLIALRRKCRKYHEEYQSLLVLEQGQKPVKQMFETCEKVEDLYIVDCKDYSYDELITQQLEAQDIEEFRPSKREARKIMKHIRYKAKKREEKLLREHFQDLLLTEVFKSIRDDKDKELDQRNAEKLQKKSEFEKELERRLLEIRYQKDLMLKNAKLAHDIQEKRDDEEFIRKLFEEDLDNKLLFVIQRNERLAMHQKLREERLKAKALKHQNLCGDIVKDLVDMALRIAEYKECFGIEPDKRLKRQWAMMFIRQQPFFDTVVPQDDVKSLSEQTPSVFYLQEIERIEIQDALNREEFLDYLELLEEDEVMAENLNILGHIVHRLLLYKYPRDPPIPPKLDIEYSLSVCINSLDVDLVMDTLRHYLQNRAKVIVFDEAKDYCVRAYEEESKEVEVTESIVGEISPKSPKKGKKGKKGKKDKKGGRSSSKGSKKSKSSEKKSKKDKSSKGSKGKGKKGKGKENVAEKILLEEKENQTPRLFPYERILSPKAELGKLATDEENINDRLLVAMFIEYLKSFPDLEGWVLLNYPTTFEQATILEEYLTGKDVPKPYITEDEAIRRSKLLPKPIEKEHETTLTAYIKLIEQDEFGIDVIFDELEASELDMFYTKLGCNYLFNYQKFDTDTLKRLAKLIVGTFIPPKTSQQLFGDLKKIKEEKQEKGGKKSKKDKKSGGKSPKKGKSSKKDKSSKKSKDSSKKSKKTKKDKSSKGSKGKKKGKGGPAIIEQADEEVQVPEPIVEDLIVYRPGQLGYIYTKLPVPLNSALMLADIWENAEESYIEGFHEIFSNRRMVSNAIWPYLVTNKRQMMELIEKPDDKQYVLDQFHAIVNQTLRKIKEDEEGYTFEEQLADELQTQQFELRERLTESCDQNMHLEENERKRILEENWIGQQVCTLMNSGVMAFQLEIDRFIDTMLIITNYYSTAITHKDITNQQFTKIQLEKIYCATVTTEIARQFVEDTFALCTKFVEDIKALSFPLVPKTIHILDVQKKKEKDDMFADKSDVLDDSDKIADEWNCALSGEIARSNFYINEVKEEVLDIVTEILKGSDQVFQEIYDTISKKYVTEMEQVEKACDILQKSIERRCIVRRGLVLGEDLAALELRLFPPIEHEKWTFEQLDYVVTLLLDLAPTGWVPEKSFQFLLQELIVDPDDRMPLYWDDLRMSDLCELTARVFDPYECVQWKDFIINNLPIKFPTQGDMRKLRQNLRTIDVHSTELIKENEYARVAFWLNDDEFRELMYKMYRNENHDFNYTAMLLDFCKDIDPVEGLVKALELSLGKKICSDPIAGEEYVAQITAKREADDEEQAKRDAEVEAIVAQVNELLATLIDITVDDCDCGLVLTEVTDKPPPAKKPAKKGAKRPPPPPVVQVAAEPVVGRKIDYFLPFDLIAIVVAAAIPVGGRTLRDQLEEVYEDCKNPTFNYTVLAHEFLNCERLHTVMEGTRKFTLINFGNVIEDILKPPDL